MKFFRGVMVWNAGLAAAWGLALFASSALPVRAQAQTKKETKAAYAPPKLPDGQHNIEGIWRPITSGAAYSILPHPGGFFLGTGSDKGVVEGGVLPYQPWAVEKAKELTAHMELDPTGHCHYEGIPHANYFPFQIFQTPKYIAVIYENMHARRLIYMDGSPHPKGVLSWMGDSRGHWEGSTLVVDVRNNNDKSVFDMAGHFHSDALHVIERFTPLDKDNINLEAWLEDSKVFTRPWKMSFPLRRAPADTEILESGCFEGERDAVHLVNGLAKIPEDHYKQ